MLCVSASAGDQYMYLIIPETLTALEKTTAATWQKTSFGDTRIITMTELPQWVKAGATNRVLCIDINRKDNAACYKKIDTSTISKTATLTGNNPGLDLLKAGYAKVKDPKMPETTK